MSASCRRNLNDHMDLHGQLHSACKIHVLEQQLLAAYFDQQANELRQWSFRALQSKACTDEFSIL